MKTLSKSTLFTLALVLGAASAQHAGHDGATFTLSQQGAKFSLQGPAQLASGYTSFTLKNTAQAPFTPVIALLKAGVTDAQVKAALGKLMASHGEDMTAINNIASFVGGSGGVQPGATFEFGANLDAGKYVVFGFGATDDGKALYDVGQYGTFTVSSAKSGVTAPKAAVQATLQDYKVVLPASIKAGKLTWQVSNKGAETHHLMLMRIADGKTMKDVEAFFKSENPEQAGPPPFEDVGGLETVSKGRGAFVNFDLKPGSYFAACFLPSATKHAPHFMLGMMTPFEVK
ncbi:hypothetical protein [Deinococcus pimensis]|uniref:hypothetical protein n=1 Tax=Deinococcus pimensis TaxID=309888 RepID=UPI00048758D0|nr:hypothetical protein [Deinococcus pimensis]